MGWSIILHLESAPARVTTKMTQKLPILLTISASLALSGCASKDGAPQYRESALSRLPFVYQMTIQQGNIITEDMIDRLEPGMTRNQVRYLLGTPMLVDIFHEDRWYYTYTIRRAHQEMEKKPLVIHFDGDAMTRVEGFIKPDPDRAAEREPEEIIVSVPDWEGDKGLVKRAMKSMGLENDD
jgi:outer membrane protein assembly factor BamE